MGLTLRGLIKAVFTAIFLLFWSLSANSIVIERTITIDGNFGDWKGTTPITPPGTDTSPGTNIVTNTGQFTSDAEETDESSPGVCADLDATFKATPAPGACGLKSTGRDLEYFSFTFDSNVLYLYVRRYASENNATDWFFYLDADGDGVLIDTERVLRVAWTGSNGNTAIQLYEYLPSNPAGDVISGGDGFTMPGSLGNLVTYNLTSSLQGAATTGSLAGLEMETSILWSDLCASCTGPQSLGFHVSSGNSTNLPSGIIDNMTGVGSGAISLLDLAVTKSASGSIFLGGGPNFVYTIEVENLGGGDATNVSLVDALPSDVTYVSDNSGGDYNSTTGVWTIGDINEFDTASIEITVSPNVVGSTTTVTNTANNLNFNESDTDPSNNEDSVDVVITSGAPTPPDISYSTKQVVDLNGSDPFPGDRLRYTIEVINGGGTSATVVVQDDIPPNTGSLRLISIPSGAINNSASSSFDIEITNVVVPGGGSVEIIFDVVIDTAAVDGATIPNTATITDPVGPDASPSAPTLIVRKGSRIKQMYFGPSGSVTMSGITFPGYSVGRIPFTSTTGISIAGGASQSWTLNPYLVKTLEIDGSTGGAGGVSMPLELILSRSSAGADRNITAQAVYENICGVSAPVVLGTDTLTVLSSQNGPAPFTLSLNVVGDKTVSVGGCVKINITNNGTRSVSVHPSFGGNTSRLESNVFTIINVDSVDFYDDTYANGGSIVSTVYPGNQVYIRAVVSDPFGDFDITNASLSLFNPTPSEVVSVASMTSVVEVPSDDPSIKIYEYGPYTMPSTPLGVWNASVTANEGTEGLQHTGFGSVLLAPPLPMLSVTKVANRTTVNPLGIITYTITVQNLGNGTGATIIVDDDLSPYVALDIDADNNAGNGLDPFVFNALDSTLLRNATTYDDGTNNYTHSLNDSGGLLSGYDADVSDWRMTFTGSMPAGTSFTLTYDVKVE